MNAAVTPVTSTVPVDPAHQTIQILSSTPIVSGTTGMTAPIPVQITSGTTGGVKYSSGASCDAGSRVAWPAIILALIGGVLVVYTAIAPGVNTNARIFGIILLTLWTIMWALILWVMWRDCHRSISWWLLFIPLTVMGLFFVLIIIMNMGMSI